VATVKLNGHTLGASASAFVAYTFEVPADVIQVRRPPGNPLRGSRL
jgi:hypothetical protein